MESLDCWLDFGGLDTVNRRLVAGVDARHKESLSQERETVVWLKGITVLD